MTRGVTLGQLIEDVQAESGHSISPAVGQNVRPLIKRTIQRVQKWLYGEHDWPFLIKTWDVETQAGMNYHNIPADLNFERILSVKTKYNSLWHDVEYGIDECHYNIHDPAQDVRLDPIYRWQEGPLTDRQIEVWPLPATDGLTLRFRGVRNLGNLLADSDTADMDDELIILFSAAEFLARQGNKDAGAKLEMAKSLLTRAKAHQSKPGRDIIVMGQIDPSKIRQPREIRVVSSRSS